MCVCVCVCVCEAGWLYYTNYIQGWVVIVSISPWVQCPCSYMWYIYVLVFVIYIYPHMHILHACVYTCMHSKTVHIHACDISTSLHMYVHTYVRTMCVLYYWCCTGNCHAFVCVCLSNCVFHCTRLHCICTCGHSRLYVPLFVSQSLHSVTQRMYYVCDATPSPPIV